MKLAIAFAYACLALGGCWWTDADDYQPIPQQTRIPPTGPAPIGAVSGRVCLLVDPRFSTMCETTIDLSSITITLGDVTTRASADGAFSFHASPVGTNLAFTLAGPTIMRTTVGFSPNTVLPVLSQSLYNQMLNSIGFTPQSPNGGVLAFVSQGGTPLANVSAVATPTGVTGPFYDGNSGLTWNGISTGVAGAMWLPGQAPGPTVLGLHDLTDNTEQNVEGIQVIDGGITMVNTAFP